MTIYYSTWLYLLLPTSLYKVSLLRYISNFQKFLGRLYGAIYVELTNKCHLSYRHDSYPYPILKLFVFVVRFLGLNDSRITMLCPKIYYFKTFSFVCFNYLDSLEVIKGNWWGLFNCFGATLRRPFFRYEFP